MKPSKSTIFCALFCLALGFGLSQFVTTPQANAQFGAPVSAARFQISAFSGDSENSHGAYAIDSMTGVVWLLLPNQAPKRVNQNLP